MARTPYSQYLSYIMDTSHAYLATIFYCLLVIVGIVVFVVLPHVEKGSLKASLLRTDLAGLITHSTYDLTNLAT